MYVWRFFNFPDIEGRDSVSAMNPIYTYGHDFSRHLAQGLADNWSQVSKHYSSICYWIWWMLFLSFYLHMQHRYNNEIICDGIRCPWLPQLQIFFFFFFFLSFNLLIGWQLYIWSCCEPFFSLLYNRQLLCSWQLALSILIEVFPWAFFRILHLQGCLLQTRYA